MVESFRLEVGTVLAADPRTFVPIEAEPSQTLHDRLDRSLDLAGLVGVLDAQDELAAVPTGEQPREQGGADVANVRVAGGTRCETGSDIGHGPSSR